LANALDLGALGVELHCSRCLRRTNFSAAQTRVTWKKRALTFPEIAAKTRCKGCGQAATEAKPRWPHRPHGNGPLMVAAPKEWERVRVSFSWAFSRPYALLFYSKRVSFVKILC
jgi:hypothetical protein